MDDWTAVGRESWQGNPLGRVGGREGRERRVRVFTIQNGKIVQSSAKPDLKIICYPLHEFSLVSCGATRITTLSDREAI